MIQGLACSESVMSRLLRSGSSQKERELPSPFSFHSHLFTPSMSSSWFVTAPPARHGNGSTTLSPPSAMPQMGRSARKLFWRTTIPSDRGMDSRPGNFRAQPARIADACASRSKLTRAPAIGRLGRSVSGTLHRQAELARGLALRRVERDEARERLVAVEPKGAAQVREVERAGSRDDGHAPLAAEVEREVPEQELLEIAREPIERVLKIGGRE